MGFFFFFFFYFIFGWLTMMNIWSVCTFSTFLDRTVLTAHLARGYAFQLLKSRNVSVTDSEIQSAGELFQMEQEIAQLEEAVIQEESEKAHAGT